jgi:hypothetical protein
MSKVVDMVSDVGRQGCYCLLTECMPFLGKLLRLLADHKKVVQDETIGHQMIELDDFTLFIPAVFGDHAFSSKQGPLRKPIKRFTLFMALCRVARRNPL